MNVFSEISFLWLIPIVLVSAGISYFYYRNQVQLKDVSIRIVRLLMVLRGASLFLICLLLLGILIETTEYNTEKPVFINIIDNSSSMLNYKDSSEVKKLVDEYRTELDQRFNDRFEIVTYVLDEKLAESKIKFDQVETNLERSYDFIYNQYYNRNIGGICLISDGNFNVGQNPLYTAEKIALTPMFALSVGDTIQKRDQLIKTVSANQIAILGNHFPIEVDIEATKLQGKKSKIQVISGGKVISEQLIQFPNESLNFQHHTLMLTAGQIGFVQYTVKLISLDGEASYANNVKTIYVEVLDGRNKILFLASAPHPDVTAVKQVLDQDVNLEVKSVLLDEWDGVIGEEQLVIIHGPHGGKLKQLSEAVKRLNKPLFVLLDNKTRQNDLDLLQVNLQLPTGQQRDEVQGYVRSEFQLFEISESVKELMIKSPPLQVPFGKMGTKSGDVLISQRIAKVEKQDPLIFFGKNQSGKYGVVVGEGLWRWKLSEYGRTEKIDGFSELIGRSVQYLLAHEMREPLRVTLPKRFTINEEISVAAEFYNEALKPITSVTIDFDLKNEKGEKFAYSFAKLENSYGLDLGKLKAGKYSWVARTKHNGKKFQKSGEFVVEQINVEDLKTTSDFNTLSQLTKISSGKLLPLKNYKSLLDQLDQRKDIVNVTYEESDFSELIEMISMLILLVLLLSSEWFVRRYYGTY